ncbi:hypothetical protein AnaeK_2995 [Anaeromyxobacter sp. K]|uniref:hypothetical protein n=1 Tax=Anaeromyxobacter sp. (strain K) TaxID=447217 RepID=UPI00015F8A95|nr:hypothetical protein [Anaeromyxobacter sp. K]ACG74217.1 hypothetical protein AnaeK_2995 [Anaeromyxobacter sp. K]
MQSPTTESSSSPHPLHDDVDGRCDFCGCAVNRETAVQRVERRDEGPEVVVLCADCAFGHD